MKTVKTALAAGISALALWATAGDLYVDSQAAAGGDGSPAAPYQTIQAAVDAAAEGATIHIAAGTYATGAKEDEFKNASNVSSPMLNRVYIDKSLTLCGEDKARTFVVGAYASTPADSAGLGLGTDAVRCIGINASNVVISNLTITGGATKAASADGNPDGNGGGIYAADGLSGIYIVDCVISNNIARRGAGACYNNDTTFGMTAVRCRFHGNRATKGSAAAFGLTAVHCLVTRHFDSHNLFLAGRFVNCTFANNYCRNLGAGNVSAANCFFADYWYKADESGTYDTCGFPITEANVTDVHTGANLFSIGFDQFVAPLLDDFRLHSGANVIGAGVMSHLTTLAIPDAFKYVDYYGNDIDSGAASCNLGCCQAAVTPEGGTVRFANMPQANKINGAYDCQPNVTNLFLFDGCKEFLIRKDLAYVRAAKWPEPIRVTVETTTWKGLYGFSASGADTAMRYPYLDGTYEIVPPKNTASTLTLTPQEAANVVYVQQDSAAVTEDGSEEAPYKDLQTAINSISSGKGIVYCKGGTFSTGSVTYESHACRIGFNSKDVRIVGVGGPANNFIVGGVDGSVAQDVWPYGMGDGATRCLYLGKSSVGSAIQGFTLTGGRTKDGTVNDNGRRGAAAFLSAGSQITDCIITNNIGFQGVAINATDSSKSATVYAFRCLVANNRQYATSGAEGTSGIIRATKGAFLILADNTGGHFGNWDYQHFYNCSFYSASSVNNIINGYSTNYNSVVSFPNASDNNNTIYGGVVQYASGAHKVESCVKADPLFADPASGDLRLMSTSPARSYGTFDYSDDYHIFIGRDFYGNPFRMIDGKPLCGAIQEFAPTVVTSGDGISPSGTMALAMGETTMTFTATGSRPLAGFSVNGVTQEVAGASYTLYVSGADSFDTAFNVAAVYDNNWYVSEKDGDDVTGKGWRSSPKKTLLGALTNAVSGDVVHVAPGTYSTGSFYHPTAVQAHGAAAIESRVYIPNGVAVVSQGSAEDTFIIGEKVSNPAEGSFGCGAGAVRCVFMEKNTRLTGFTVTGGHVYDVSESSDDVIGGGILARDNTAVISDCVISNNAARRGGGGYNGTYNRCRILGNSIISGGNGAAVRGHGSGLPSHPSTALLNNCIIAGNHGWSTFYFASLDSCTLAADNEDSNGATDGMTILRACHRVCNTLILGNKTTSETVGFSNCVFNAATATWIGGNSNATTNACLVAAADDELAIDENYAPVIGSNLAVDAGDSSMYDASKLGELDVYGRPRAVNGSRLDVGAVEAVWLPVYARKLGYAVTVTVASPAVELVDSGVRIPAGASLAATVGRVGTAGNKYLLKASVDDGGTCAIEKDGMVCPPLVAGAAQQVELTPDSDFMDLSFLAEGAATTLSRISLNVGMCISIR